MKTSRITSLGLAALCTLAFGGQQTYALASTAAALADHSAAAVGLFNNMRVPAALIAGSLVPIGILSAPQIDEKKDSKVTKLAKKANILLAGISLLNEILAVTYSSIAINKLVEIAAPPTTGVAELIAQTHLLAWVGTNVHFLLGLTGFALVVGAKAYFGGFGSKVGRAAMGWSVAVFLQAVSIINRGISMGAMDESARFASNLFTLVAKYIKLLVKSAKGGVFASAAILVGFYSIVATFQALFPGDVEAES
ncbi:MAG: hypothetical protein SGILL_002914 [Bacillariaceae sp.]